MVVTVMMTSTGISIGRSASQEFISPTAPGIKVRGMISIKKDPVSRTLFSGMMPVIRAASISTSP